MQTREGTTYKVLGEAQIADLNFLFFCIPGLNISIQSHRNTQVLW